MNSTLFLLSSSHSVVRHTFRSSSSLDTLVNSRLLVSVISSILAPSIADNNNSFAPFSPSPSSFCYPALLSRSTLHHPLLLLFSLFFFHLCTPSKHLENSFTSILSILHNFFVHSLSIIILGFMISFNIHIQHSHLRHCHKWPAVITSHLLCPFVFILFFSSVIHSKFQNTQKMTTVKQRFMLLNFVDSIVMEDDGWAV